ncbi:MAG: tetratricopeptide repeat protein [Bacteroidota bacterium]|jgi:tetratricopeptide (TPR) repeat protein
MQKQSPPSKNNNNNIDNTSSIKWIRIALVILGFVLYGASVGFDYTLDDDLFVVKNEKVQEGISAIPSIFTSGTKSLIGTLPFRPVVLSSFAIEQSLFDNNPAVRHFFNILIYIVLLQVLFSLLLKLFKSYSSIFIACIVLLYAAHPIHTEVVSSVKGRDELLAALFGFLAWKTLIDFNTKNIINYKKIILGSLFFLLSCLSKESGIVFLALIPLWNFMVLDKSIKNNLILTLPLLLSAIFYLGARHITSVDGVIVRDVPELTNILNATHNIGELTATKVTILFYYIKLLVMPWPLVWDYSFNQIPVANWSNVLPWISGLIYFFLIGFSVYQWKKNPIISFFILFFLISILPTSNLLFTTGCTMGERFLFVPSLAFAVLLTYALAYFLNKSDIKNLSIKFSNVVKIIAGITILFSGMTVARSNDWKNNFTLFESSVKASPNSARTHYSLASEYLSLSNKSSDLNQRRDYLQKAIEHFERSLTILPGNFQTLYNTGLCYSLNGDTSKAIEAYRKAIQMNNIYTNAMNNLAVIYEGQKQYDSAFYYYQMAYKISPNEKSLKQNISNLFYNKGLQAAFNNNKNLAIEEYRKSIEYGPENVMAINNIASLHAGNKQLDSCLYYLKMGYSIEPSNMMILENIAAISYLNKNYSQAIEFANKAIALNPNARKSIGVLADTYQAQGNTAEAARYRAMQNSK